MAQDRRLSIAHFLLRYTLAPDYLARRGEFRDVHLGLAWAASDRGELLLGGAVGDPVESALLLFTDAEAARAFAEADPYVTSGIVTVWEVLPRTTVAGGKRGNPDAPESCFQRS